MIFIIRIFNLKNWMSCHAVYLAICAKSSYSCCNKLCSVCW